MSVKEFEDFIVLLESRGYKKCYDPIYKREQWYKSFGKGENAYEANRSLYQVFFDVYDWRGFWGIDSFLRERGNAYSFGVRIFVSRVIDESPIECRFDDYSDIDMVERRALSFFKYVEECFEVPLVERIVE